MRGVIIIVLTILGAVGLALAGEVPSTTRQFLKQNCLECHDSETAKGGVALDVLGFDLNDRAQLERWLQVIEQVDSGDMPPEKAGARASAAATRAFLDPLRNAVRQHAARAGASRVRRLNRVEYEQTLRDLLALPALRVKDLLPEDGSRHGYDKVAGALDLSQVQMSRFLTAAEVALRTAAQQPAQAITAQTWREPAARQHSAYAAMAIHKGIPLKDGRFVSEGYSSKLVGEGPNGYRAANFSGTADSLAILSNVLGAHQAEGIQIDRFKPPVPGLYRVRFAIWSMTWDRNEVKPATPSQRRGKDGDTSSEVIHVVRASLGDTRLGFFDAPSLTPSTHEFTVWLEPGQRVSFHTMSLTGWGPENWPSKNGIFDYTGPGVVYDWFEVEGPLQEPGPSPSRRHLFGDSGRADSASMTTVMRRFAERAFRRPVTEAELTPYLALAEAQTKVGHDAESAMLTAYQAMLCAPDFLFLGLEDGLDTVGKPTLGTYALASRLAFLLTNAPPDDELLAQAASGALRQRDVLRRQAERLLASPASARFVGHFLDQWLALGKIDATQPDKDLYPHYDDWLRDAMVSESRTFFRTLLDEDLPVDHLVASPFVTIDGRLARHYGIADVQGSRMRKVSLPKDNPRGGFLTQAAVLKVTANGTATSPVLRGAWVTEHLLGLPRKPPPPNVPAVEPDARSAVTIRQLIEQHRADRACAGCHAVIDPPGMALENFDAIGAWRTTYRGTDKQPGLAIDASGKLKTGGAFQDVHGLRTLLAKNDAGLARNLVRQFLTYASGSPTTFLDREAIEAVVASTKAQHYGVRSLLLAVITSDLFQSK